MSESVRHADIRLSIDAVLIAGPTASGKSRAALDLAQATGGTVINADSMQVYREPRILTARPSDADMRRAPHRLYGHVGIRELYSVGRYQSDAIQALGEVRAAGQLPIFTGGTGLYFTALTEGLSDIPAIPDAVRTAARARLDADGVAALHAALAARDPVTAAGLRPSDPQRVLRAWEVLEATGRPLSHWQKQQGRPALDGLKLAKFVLDVPRPVLIERIAARFKAMIDEGAPEEAALLAGLDPALPAAKLLGLREMIALREGSLSEDQAVEAAVIATRQFAKRQLTWFRHRMCEWTWLNPSDGNIVSEIVRSIV